MYLIGHKKIKKKLKDNPLKGIKLNQEQPFQMIVLGNI